MTPYLLVYVESPLASAEAIEAVLGLSPVERSTTFALFVVGATRLGFWTRADIQPPAGEAGENSEFALGLDSREAVDRQHAEWRARGLTVLQAPEEMDFGYTATVALPGPFRLRVFRTADNPV